MMKTIWCWTLRVLKGAAYIAPIVMGAISGYLLFLVILPFFLVGGHRLSTTQIVYRKADMIQALGEPAAIIAVLLLAGSWVVSYLWALSFVHFLLTRRWYVLALMILSPLPIAYIQAGPYASHFRYWVFPS